MTTAVRRRGGGWRQWAIAGGACALAAVIGLLIWLRFARPIDARMQAIVDLERTEATSLPVDANGFRVSLAGRFGGVTPHDEMYLTRLGDGSFRILFPTFYGNGVSIACLLYTSRPLRSTDVYERQQAAGASQTVIDVTPYRHMVIDGRVNEHWYRVSNRMQ